MKILVLQKLSPAKIASREYSLEKTLIGLKYFRRDNPWWRWNTFEFCVRKAFCFRFSFFVFFFLFHLITMQNSIHTKQKQNWASSFSVLKFYKFCKLGFTTIIRHVCDLQKLKTSLLSRYSRYIFLPRQVNGSIGFHSIDEASLWSFFCAVLLYSCLNMVNYEPVKGSKQLSLTITRIVCFAEIVWCILIWWVLRSTNTVLCWRYISKFTLHVVTWRVTVVWTHSYACELLILFRERLCHETVAFRPPPVETGTTDRECRDSTPGTTREHLLKTQNASRYSMDIRRHVFSSTVLFFFIVLLVCGQGLDLSIDLVDRQTDIQRNDREILPLCLASLRERYKKWNFIQVLNE